MLKQLVVIVATSLLLLSCEESYESQVEKLIKFSKKNPIGSSQDVWLVKRSIYDPDRVALIFGYSDDMAFCQEISSMYMQRYPGDKYYCERITPDD